MRAMGTEASGEGVDDDDSMTTDPPSSVHMTCVYQHGYVGCAWYDVNTGEMFVVQVQDACDGGADFEALDLAKRQANPGIIYVASTADESFVARLKSHGQDADDESTETSVRMEASSIFSIKNAYRTLQSLHIRGLGTCSSTVESLQLLNSVMDLSCASQVCAAGALVTILHRENMLGAAQPGLLVDDQADAVPSRALTVYGVLNRCVTQIGRRLLRLWLMRPVLNMEDLQDRQETVACFIQHPDIAQKAQVILKQVRDVPKLLHRLKSTQTLLNPKDLKLLSGCIEHLILLRDLFLSLGAEMARRHTHHDDSGTCVPGAPQPVQAQEFRTLGVIRKATSSVDESIQSCYSLIANVVDFDQYEQSGMFVANGVSPELDRLKHTYYGLPDFLTQVVQHELTTRVPRSLTAALCLQKWSIVYMPQVGFVTRIQGPRLTADLQECLPDYKVSFQIENGDAVGTYYVSDRTSELNNKFGDMLHKIHDLEASICTELVLRISTFNQVLHRGAAFAAEVDCLVSLAVVARENNYARPTLTHDNVLCIKNGRHPLAELSVSQFVPNDTLMPEDGSRIQVLTGPNFSGKSCYAKQVGVIVIMAHIGSFVPADAAIIGLTDRIFTRIGSLESNAVQQSSFALDLTQISKMLRLATSRSLCLIDEFGKGTLTSDGIGLFSAALTHFSRLHPSPKVIACTHFSELLNPRFLPRNPSITFLTMETIVKRGSNCDDEVVFLYRCQPGGAAPSFGINCARLAGIGKQILERAAQVVLLVADGEEIGRTQAGRMQAIAQRHCLTLEELVAMNANDSGMLDQFLAKT